MNNTAYKCIEIPAAADNAKAIRKALRSLKLSHTELTKKDRTTAFEVYYTDPAQLYQLGGQVVAQFLTELFPHIKINQI